MPSPKINRAIINNKFQLQPETLQWLSALSTPPTPTTISCVNQFIAQCKVDGNWQLLDRFWLFAQDNQTNARKCIRNPTSTDVTEINSITWTAFLGYTGNGTTMSINSNFTPSTNGVNYTLNNASFGLYNRTEGALASYEIGVNGLALINYAAINVRWTDNKNYWIINNNTTFANITVSTSIGLHQVNRTASNATNVNLNGAQVGTGSVASSSLSALPFYLFARNDNGSISGQSTRNISLAFIGSGSIDVLKMYNAVQTLATQLKFNV